MQRTLNLISLSICCKARIPTYKAKCGIQTDYNKPHFEFKINIFLFDRAATWLTYPQKQEMISNTEKGDSKNLVYRFKIFVLTY